MMLANNDTANTASSIPEVSRVAMRLPPFWPADPEVWFSQIESQFKVAGITSDETKFNYIVGNLEPTYATEVRDILTKPPATEKYDTLKKELIRRLSESQQQKTKRLLEHEELGDRKPSQFLRHLQNLAGDVAPESLVRSLWLSRLPAVVQAILATHTDTALKTVAELADSILEATSQHQVAQVSASNSSSNKTEALLEQLVASITAMSVSFNKTAERLREEIAEVASDCRGRQRDRSNYRYRSTSRNSSRSSSRNRSGQCWYHFRFGDNARKCRPPCTKQTENLSGGR